MLARASKEEVVLTVPEQTRAVLLRMLTVRFGPVGDDVKARVEAADVETLERWAERFATASTMAAVFEEG